MGNIAPSSPAMPENPSKGFKFSGGRGRSASRSMSQPGLAPSFVSLPSETLMKLELADMTHNTVDEEDEEITLWDDSESEDEEEEDAEWEERLQILEDARNMKKMAEFFLHPENPVESEGCARCFFDRASAPERLSKEESDELALIQEENEALKKVAVEFLHPELPVVTNDPSVCSRNFFVRPSAYTETVEDDEERSAVMEDLMKLKSLAQDYLHPERPVRSSIAVTRCYLDVSADLSPEESLERSLVLQDVDALKRSAVDYLHPELPVSVTDATASSRCYFDRPSAPSQEDVTLFNERVAVLADAAALKGLATQFSHPEAPLEVNALMTSRCYFERASAPVQSSVEEAESNASILEDCLKLKTLAVRYMHPEVAVPCGTTARCYFDRASAPEQEPLEDAAERYQVLKDASVLKMSATDFLHPEIPVNNTSVPARCYFSRASAPPQETPEDSKNRALVLEDMKQLKRLVTDFMHPEVPMAVASTGTRCFFDRASGVEQLSIEDEEERARILEDVQALKKSSVQYLHPELPLETSSTVAGARCYFDRISGPAPESPDTADYRAQVLEDTAALKKLANDFLHPELPVGSTDAGCARCYFDRYSAQSTETTEDAEEAALALADAAALKKYAIDYMHPELPVQGSDPTTTSRCFFDRPSTRLHDQMIHSFPPHEDDDHSDHHEHGDHFGMDEDFGFLNEVREKLTGAGISHSKNLAEDEVESNLSRSPSSVMLFQEESIYD